MAFPISTPENVTARKLSLDLHTDLQNLNTYAGNPVMIAALIATAEEKVAILAGYLVDARAAAGLSRSPVILHSVGG